MALTTAATSAPVDTRLYIIAVLSLTAVQMLSTIAFNIGAVLAPVAAPDLGVAADDVAYYVSAVYLVSIYAAMAGGPMAVRLGPVRLTQCGLTISAIACLSLASGHVVLAALSAIILGLGGGPLTAASSQILARVTPQRLSNLTFSIKQSGVPLGYALAGALIPISVELHGWQAVAAAIAVICLMTALALQPLRALYDRDGVTTGRLLPTFQQIVDPLKRAWADPVLRRLCLAAMFFSAMQATIVNFTILYGVNGLLLDYVAAGLLLSVATAAGMVGRVFWGALADATRRPLAMLALLGAIMTLGGFAMAAAQLGWPSWVLHGVAIVLGGSAIGWNGVFISECARRAPPGRAGEFVGATSFFVFLGPVLWPVMFRAILYATQSYPAGFAIMATATGVSAVAITGLLRRGER
ncbi:MFS transporter [Vineibacter terrae]|uniref:MFS transporter n=1 Tax=Vineibacter terrae TaxID=2586908 RepID=A0A5C8PJP5_9HYPH|nr:MFS transporter [Vineibacter terrae]TXL73579.1 MFS transporter [Vineibacter terrae]